MLSDIGFEVDLEALDDVLRRADVITVGFTTFVERLLIDTRTNSVHGPLLMIVEPVGNVEERYLWLRQHRPTFGAPQAFSFFIWPRTVRGLVEQDTLQALRRRMHPLAPTFGKRLDEALEGLRVIERAAWLAVITGQRPWATLWQAS